MVTIPKAPVSNYRTTGSQKLSFHMGKEPDIVDAAVMDAYKEARDVLINGSITDSENFANMQGILKKYESTSWLTSDIDSMLKTIAQAFLFTRSLSVEDPLERLDAMERMLNINTLGEDDSANTLLQNQKSDVVTLLKAGKPFWDGLNMSAIRGVLQPENASSGPLISPGVQLALLEIATTTEDFTPNFYDVDTSVIDDIVLMLGAALINDIKGQAEKVTRSQNRHDTKSPFSIE